jgi:hypothetical protein
MFLKSALCTVNSVEYGKKVQDPFYMDMKENTSVKYTVEKKQIAYTTTTGPRFQMSSQSKRMLISLTPRKLPVPGGP